MWLIPSRRRVNKLRNFVTSAVNAETTTPGLIIIDDQDFKDNKDEYLKMEKHNFPKDWQIITTQAEGMGPKIREVWPKLEGSQWVGVLNDDHFIVTKHWDTILINQLNGKNFITCNDRWNAPKRAAGATVFSMPLMKAFGFPMFPKQIDHLGIDDVFECIGRATGCWEVDMKVIVEHHHAFKNADMVDDTHRKVYGTKPWNESQESKDTQERFTDWLSNDFPDIVKKVNQLRRAEQINELPLSVPNGRREVFGR